MGWYRCALFIVCSCTVLPMANKLNMAIYLLSNSIWFLLGLMVHFVFDLPSLGSWYQPWFWLDSSRYLYFSYGLEESSNHLSGHAQYASGEPGSIFRRSFPKPMRSYLTICPCVLGPCLFAKGVSSTLSYLRMVSHILVDALLMLQTDMTNWYSTSCAIPHILCVIGLRIKTSLSIDAWLFYAFLVNALGLMRLRDLLWACVPGSESIAAARGLFQCI